MPPTDDQLRAIGWVTLLYNDLKHNINFLAWRLINPDINIGRAVLGKSNFDRMLSQIKRLSREVARKDQQLGDTIEQWAERARKVKERRNNVVHAQWLFDNPSGDVVAFSNAPQEVDLSPAALEQLANDIQDANSELTAILRQL